MFDADEGGRYVVPMAQTISEREDESESKRLERIAAIILGLAALVAAVTAYRSALADGDAAAGFAESNAHLSDANFFYAKGNGELTSDQDLFLQLIVAEQGGQTVTADYIENTLMSDNLRSAVEDWRSTDLATPFDGDTYVLPEAIGFGDEEQLAAEESARQAKDDDQLGDKFELAGVLLAICLFMAGIATLFEDRQLTKILLGVAGVSLVGGAVVNILA